MLVCEFKADVLQDSKGITPLMFAARAGYEDVVCVLCEYGRLLDCKDSDGDIQHSTMHAWEVMLV